MSDLERACALLARAVPEIYLDSHGNKELVGEIYAFLMVMKAQEPPTTDPRLAQELRKLARDSERGRPGAREPYTPTPGLAPAPIPNPRCPTHGTVLSITGKCLLCEHPDPPDTRTDSEKRYDELNKDGALGPDRVPRHNRPRPAF